MFTMSTCSPPAHPVLRTGPPLGEKGHEPDSGDYASFKVPYAWTLLETNFVLLLSQIWLPWVPVALQLLLSLSQIWLPWVTCMRCLLVTTVVTPK